MTKHEKCIGQLRENPNTTVMSEVISSQKKDQIQNLHRTLCLMSTKKKTSDIRHLTQAMSDVSDVFHIHCNVRICAMKLVSGGKTALTVIGAYMPYWDGSNAHVTMYVETLEDIQCIIDMADPAPILLCGDVNTSLPQATVLDRNWHIRHS